MAGDDWSGESQHTEEWMRGRAAGWQAGYEAYPRDMAERNDTAVQELRAVVIRDMAERLITLLGSPE